MIVRPWRPRPVWASSLIASTYHSRSRPVEFGHRSEACHRRARPGPPGQGGHRHARARMGAAPDAIEPRDPRLRALAQEGRRPSVRGPSIKGPTRRREQRVEIRRRDEAMRELRLQLQPASGEAARHGLRALVELLLGEFVGVAIGGRVDDDLEAFAARRCGAWCGIFGQRPAILRAQVDRWIGDLFAAPQLREFRAVIGRKEHVVARQREALRLRMAEPDQRGERAAGARRASDRAPCLLAEAPAGERCGIGIAQHRVRRDPLPVVENDAGGAARSGFDPGHPFAEQEPRAVLLREGFQRLCQRAHPAVDQPHALRLDMRDQHERGGRVEGRGAAICRVATEELAQALVLEMLAEHLPQALVRTDRGKIADAREADALHQRKRPEYLLLPQQAFIEDIVDPPRLGPEAAVAARGLRPGEVADRFLAAHRIGEQVESLALGPGVARDDRGGADGERGTQVAAADRENLLEHIAHREDRGARIDRLPVDGELARLAADAGLLLDHRDVVTARGEERCADQPADTGSDHDGGSAHPRASSPKRLLFTSHVSNQVDICWIVKRKTCNTPMAGVSGWSAGGTGSSAIRASSAGLRPTLFCVPLRGRVRGPCSTWWRGSLILRCF